MVFFCPFTYNKNLKSVDDIFGHFSGVLNTNDGVVLFRNYNKSLEYLGGLNNLLPIGELMLINRDSKDIIVNEEALEEFMNILRTIFCNNNLHNLSEAYSQNFFSTLVLFLERLQKNIYTEKILDIFLDIGKEELKFSKDIIIIDDIESEKDNFIRDILLDIKIIDKFNIQTQMKLWDNLYQFFRTDYSQIKASFNISKISTLLRYYDENRYIEYCCLYHSNLFQSNNSKNNKNTDNIVMNPEMCIKTDQLFNILQLYLDKLNHEEENTNLFKLLCLDFSPCIQKRIILLYISHFSDESITDDIKLKTVNNLLSNNFFDVIEYVFSVSLIDIKQELINLFSIILKYYINNSSFTKKIPSDMKDIIEFIGDNILPEQLIVKINSDSKNSKIKKAKFELLSKYYNRKEYEIQIEELWKLLQSLMFKSPLKDNKKIKENRFEINELFINLCISFVSKNIITKYIYDLINIIQEFLVRKDITNLYILYEKDFLYIWLIETIFYFNIKENTKDTSKKTLYEDIKENSLDLLKDLFISSKGKEKFNRIKYVIYFAYKLKRMLDANKSCINDIEIILRTLLNTFLDCENMNLNFEQLTIICYEFIIFFKDSEKYIGESIFPSNLLKDNQTNSIRRNMTNNLFFSLRTPGLSSLKKIENEDDELNVTIDYEKLIKENEVVPDCIYEGLYYINNNMKNNSLLKTWKDFPIYEKIIKYYRKNFWGLDKICKNIKESPKKKLHELYMKFIKEYTENKNYKNILYQDLSILLNISDNNSKEKKAINILNINAQLLAISYTLSFEEKERQKIEQHLNNFITYCILASLNINTTEKDYNKIQDHLYNILGFSFNLIEKQNPTLYKEILEKLITPIFIQINTDLNKKSILNYLGVQKKNIYANSALFKLFDYMDKTQTEPNLTHRSSTFISELSLGQDNQNDNKSENNNTIKDDYKINISHEGITILKVNKENILRQSFPNSLVYYKKQRSKIKIEDIKLLLNYNNLITGNEKLIKETKERKRVNKAIINLISILENHIKKHFNITLLTEKKRRNNYKSIKKKLFSWCFFWSDKNIFYKNPQVLKLKKMNHFSKEMCQFLLKPILDIEYELPNFKKFDNKNLFQETKLLYKINLDIDDVLNVQKKLRIKGIKSKGNFIESIYKYTYSQLWEKYELYKIENIYKKNISLSDRATYDILVSNKYISKDREKKKNENIYNCCLVKPTHHICGYISTENKRIIFIYDSEDNNDYIEDDLGFDNEMKCCFGSIFKGHQKDKDIINLNIKYDEIKYMFYKMYFYNLSAIEIYTKSNKSYFFNFKNNKNLSQFVDDVLYHGNFREIKLRENFSKLIGYEFIPDSNAPSTSKKNINYFLTTKYEDWRNHKISTLELLMWMNILSGRSFHDMTQYPVFPWVLTDFLNEEINLEENMRNMELPIGLLESSSETRKEAYIEIYESVKSDLNEIDPEFIYQEYLLKGSEYYDLYLQNKFKNAENTTYIQPNQLPYFFGTHYSNATYVSHYLTRIFPYSFISIEIQGEKFDDKDRLFSSMQKTFESAMTLKDDVRELIPEFFILPEMFLNINKLNFNSNEIDDVELPLWAQSSAYYFVSQLRNILEKDNLNINQWFDLIFGFKQRGEKAELAQNIYMGTSYQDNVKIENYKDNDVRNTLMRLVEIGMNPIQLFDDECKSKFDINYLLTKNINYLSTKGKFLYESDIIITKYIITSKYKRICEHFYYNYKNSSNKDYKVYIFPKIIKIKYISKDLIKIFTNTNLYYSMQFSLKGDVEETDLYEIENQSSKFSPSYLISSINPPVIISHDNNYIFKGGFWDGRVEINYIGKGKEKYLECIYPNDDDPVIEMKISKDDKFLLCGTKKGILVIILIEIKNKTKVFSIYKKIFDHNNEINSIFISDKLNVCATCAKDGNIICYTIPKFKLFRCIKIMVTNDEHKEDIKNENKNIYANNIFLSNSPIPCISVFISSQKLFKTYSINGVPLYENYEIDNSAYINSSKVIYDLNFQEYLIYGTNNGFIKIRKFPELNLVNFVEFLDGQPIEAFDLSFDHRFCYAYSGGENIAVFCEPEAGNIEIKDNEETQK